MSPLVDLTINAAISGKEVEFDQALAERAVREQHWSDRAGLGGDAHQASGLHEVMMDRGGEMCERLITEHGWSEPDFRHAARRLEATGDPDPRTLAQHVRAWEMFANEKETEQMTNATEAMTRQLVNGLGEEYLREQRTQIGNRDSMGQQPRQSGWLGYPANVRPVAEPDVDGDRPPAGPGPRASRSG